MADKYRHCTSGREVLEFAKEHGAKLVDFKFSDPLGAWQHFVMTLDCLSEESFSEGVGFDGSSIRGWQAIQESDMLILPDPYTAFIDPFTTEPTLSLICSVIDPITRQSYSRDPRNIAAKAEAYLKSTGIADTAYFGPEAEFFIFDEVRYDNEANGCFYEVQSVEGIWNSGRDEMPNLGHKIRHKEGYFPVPPSDTLQDVRNEMVLTLESLGVPVERQHHEVATAGQAEIDIRYDSLLRMGDKMSIYKYVIKNVAKKYGKTATFMPKPLFGDNGSGMHTHQSLWKDGKPLFAGNRYAGLSELALYYIGGLLKHAPALTAICNPTTNSYKRLVPGFEAPVNLAYSARNRSAAIRIPTYSPDPKAKRIEFRPPDPAANIYLACSAMLMAGLDGIQNRIDPGEPLEKNIYELPPEELKRVPTVPDSLRGAMEALEQDHEFLLKGDVFTKEFVELIIEMRRRDYDTLRLRPHPIEFYLYYDI
ncbi:type I glutamate--ammonia ligase [Candidatus Methylacidithermus pantelleriae]|uniref:Glutamine synthetase n=1 Tax=Candidatus Methylacidithermus pantelleriae TaxID=2744239 RepID=A0A8J2BVX6_9BACT|nr:type I glutamate--ammonia ligase [Candidatus Methylacidithermus pantelleriae]CAF0704980.1 Glutamine synthetase [Candidatus Methylacidithermus pantelleriae]